jgi:hypothetical protein
VVIDRAHPVARLPLDQCRSLAGLRILKEDLPSRSRREFERACVLGIEYVIGFVVCMDKPPSGGWRQ